MSLRRKLEGEAEIRATAADFAHELFTSKAHHFSNVVPHFVQGVELHEGDAHDNIGSISVWNYTIGGKALVAKTVLEELDEEKKYVKYGFIEGDVMKEYKTFSVRIQVMPKDNQTSIVKVTFEYEKMHDGIPEPSAMLDHHLQSYQHIDDHHHAKIN